MIDIPDFKDAAAEAAKVLAALSLRLSQLAARPCSLRLLPVLDGATRQRVLELNTDAFGREGEVFDRRALDEVAADPDALFLVLDIEGTVEGFCFGYYEEPGAETVKGTDFYFDTGMVAPHWQDRGLGEIAGAAVLLLAYLLGDVHKVGISVWGGGDPDRLVALYRRLGFVDAEGRSTPHRCLALALDGPRVARWRAVLGLAPATGPPSEGA